MRLLRILAAGLLLGGTGVAHAAGATVHVSAVILARTDVQLLGAGELVISEADVQRGYVDVPGPMTLRVRTNVTAPMALEFAMGHPAIRMARIQGLGSVVDVASGSGVVPLPAGARVFQATLQVRFFLQPDTRPGSYGWPLQVGTAT